jgi:anionic cell wall polymer biosynthesis LytR-Cps2A-Psr (LCP) family protein
VIKYIRSRHQPEGDFARIQRQQQIIEILKDKILSLSPIWDLSSFLNVWKIIKNYTITNISLIDIKYAWNLIKNFNFKEMQFTTITNQGNKENSLLISSHVMMGNDIAYILKPKAGLNNYEEIKKYITNLVNQD